MNIKKLCRKENNTNHGEGDGEIHLHRIQSLPLSSLSGSALRKVRWCPSLALSSLFETTVCGCLFQICLVPTVLPRWLSISPGPRSGSFNDPRRLPVPSPPVSRCGLWCDQEGGTLVHPSAGVGCFSLFREDNRSVSMTPHHMSRSVPDLSNNEQFLVNQLSISFEGPIYLKGAALSHLMKTAALSKH